MLCFAASMSRSCGAMFGSHLSTVNTRYCGCKLGSNMEASVAAHTASSSVCGKKINCLKD